METKEEKTNVDFNDRKTLIKCGRATEKRVK